MSQVTEILAKYSGLPNDLRAQLSAELAGMERDAGRYAIYREYMARPVPMLSRFHGCIDAESANNTCDAIMSERAAMTKGK